MPQTCCSTQDISTIAPIMQRLYHEDLRKSTERGAQQTRREGQMPIHTKTNLEDTGGPSSGSMALGNETGRCRLTAACDRSWKTPSSGPSSWA